LEILKHFVSQFGGSIDPLPEDIPSHLYEYSLKTDADKLKFKSFEKIRVEKQNNSKKEIENDKEEMKCK